jgi:DNA topoisomerase-1
LATNIIIAEKADAARRISYYLSDGKSKTKKGKGLNYIEFENDNEKSIVIPLSGHIVELDFPETLKKWNETDLETLIDARQVRNVKNRSAFSTLQEFGKQADRIIIATDYDREGELIGVEALDIIFGGASGTRKDGSILRAKFSALTGEEINAAFKDPIKVDYFLADAAGAREEIDLLWGAVLTRFFSLATNRLGKNFISLGRVQTPTLALIVKREIEIRNFVPEPFWKLEAIFHKDIDFNGEYAGGTFTDKSRAEAVLKKASLKEAEVREYRVEDERIYKPSPFNTTEFLREASRIGVLPSRAMKIAESLYMRGLISYPRTDNTVYQKSISLKGVLLKLKNSKYSTEAEKVLSQDRIIPSRGRQEATDHPPIYPVSAPKSGELKGEFEKIYELVVRRFLATLYKEGVKETRTAMLDVNGVEFISKGSKIKEKGWLELYPYRTVKEVELPSMAVGEKVQVKDISLNENMTKPPPRYDIASLIKTMEELMLGTKSTRHDIIEKLQSRGFIEGNPVRPTPLGMGLIESVIKINSRISDPDMTATLEKDMDRIANRTITKQEVIEESRNMLRSTLKEFREKQEVIKETIRRNLSQGEVIGDCPIDSGKISLIKNKDLVKIKCSTENCRIDFILKANGKIELAGKTCPECGLPLIKIIRRGQSPEIKCIDPKCKYNQDKDTMGKCPADGGDLVIRQSKYGKRFLGCSNYPACTVTYPLPQMGHVVYTGETCKFCNSPILAITRNKSRWVFCPKMDCEFNKKKSGKSEKAVS